MPPPASLGKKSNELEHVGDDPGIFEAALILRKVNTPRLLVPATFSSMLAELGTP
jgi:hypothetical protein